MVKMCRSLFLFIISFSISSVVVGMELEIDRKTIKPVIVRIWCDTYNHPDEVGHVSLETSKHYVSLWPRKEGQTGSKGQVVKSPGFFIESYEKELSDTERKFPSHTFVLKSLNSDKINDSYEEILRKYYSSEIDKNKIFWKIDATGQIEGDFLYHNCTTIVRYLLQKGEIYDRLYCIKYNSSLEEDKNNSDSISKEIIPMGIAYNQNEKLAANVLMYLTGKKIKSLSSGTQVVRTYFIEELEFYTPHQFIAVLTIASLMDMSLFMNEYAGDIGEIFRKIKLDSRDFLPEFDKKGQVIMHKKRSESAQKIIDENREFDKTNWSYFSLKSWARWTSDEDLEGVFLTPWGLYSHITEKLQEEK